MKNKKQCKLVGVFAIFVLAISGVMINTYFAPAPPESKKANTLAFDESPYSDEEMKMFWAEHEEPIVMQLVNRTYRIPEIGDRYTASLQKLSAEHGQLQVKMTTTYLRASHKIIGGANFDSNDVPILSLIIPATIDVFRELKNAGDPSWKEQFEYLVVVSIIHELDHLAYEPASKGSGGTKHLSLDELVLNEKKAWALTCEHAIVPLVEKYYAPLCTSDRTYYENWVKAGRNANSPAWEKFIRDAYRSTRPK